MVSLDELSPFILSQIPSQMVVIGRPKSHNGIIDDDTITIFIFFLRFNATGRFPSPVCEQ